jgi:hypothetical protein
MASLFQPVFAPLIRALPVAHHSIALESAFWHPKFTAAGQQHLWATIFGNATAIRISRSRLLGFAYPTPDQKLAEVLLWGYPRDSRGLVSRLLTHLTALSACAVSAAPWQNYFGAFPPGIGISTITKLAYFHGRVFNGLNALILDQRLIDNTVNWNQVTINGLSYSTAPQLYPHYLAAMHAAAANPALGCTADQLEFFLFSLGADF